MQRVGGPPCAGVAFFLHRRRRVRARADAELMVHRWSRDREAGGCTYMLLQSRG